MLLEVLLLYLKLAFMFLLSIIAERDEGFSEKNLYHVNNEEEVNLDAIVSCKAWYFDNKEIFSIVRITKDKADFYVCLEPAAEIFIFPVVEVLNIEPSMDNPDALLQGDLFEFTCSVTFDANTVTIRSELIILNVYGKPIANKTKEAKGERMAHRLEGRVTLNKVGLTLFSCTWFYSIELHHNRWERSVRKDLNITVYKLPTNVRPDKSNWKINETVICLADAYPHPNFTWICDGGAWSSDGRSLILFEAVLYMCTCIAGNVIKDESKMSKWTANMTVSKALNFSPSWILIFPGLAVTFRRAEIVFQI